MYVSQVISLHMGNNNGVQFIQIKSCLAMKHAHQDQADETNLLITVASRV